MKQLLHELWPLAAVVALTVVLALQIPRRALFFEPVPVTETRPAASFVAFDDATYAAVIQKVRMSWQVRGSVGLSSESRVDDVPGEDESGPVLPAHPLDAVFSAPWRPVSARTPVVPLLPPTVASTATLEPVATPPDDAAEARQRRLELLDLPPSLQATEKDDTP